MRKLMADGVGFEPTNELPRCRFSRPVPSTTRPPIRIEVRAYQGGRGSAMLWLFPVIVKAEKTLNAYAASRPCPVRKRLGFGVFHAARACTPFLRRSCSWTGDRGGNRRRSPQRRPDRLCEPSRARHARRRRRHVLWLWP